MPAHFADADQRRLRDEERHPSRKRGRMKPEQQRSWRGSVQEIRVDGSAPLHDRYIIDDSIMTILGTSLNGFGKKQCFIIQTGPDLRAVVLPVFDGLWKSATTWP